MPNEFVIRNGLKIDSFTSSVGSYLTIGENGIIATASAVSGSGSQGFQGTQGIIGVGINGNQGFQGPSSGGSVSLKDGTIKETYDLSSIRSIDVNESNQVFIGGEFGAKFLKLNDDLSIDYDTDLFNTNKSINELNATVFVVKVDPKTQKILVGGDFTEAGKNSRNRLTRYNVDGNEDTTFCANIGTAFDDSVYTIDFQSNGSIIVGGRFTQFDGTPVNKIVRLNSDGTLDATFVSNIGSGFSNYVNYIKVQTDDKILVGGTFTEFNSSTYPYLVRLNSDGTLDATFSANLGSFFNDQVYTIDIYSYGSIVVGGSFTNGIAKIMSDGTPETYFNSRISGFDGDVRSLFIQPDDKIVCGGSFINFDKYTVPYIARLNSDGYIDDDTFAYDQPINSAILFLNNDVPGVIYAARESHIFISLHNYSVLSYLNSGFGSGFLNSKTVFVDPNGSDFTAVLGNRDKPFKSIYAALKALADLNLSGWTVYVSPGSYIEESTIEIDNSNAGEIGVTIKFIGNVDISMLTGLTTLFNISDSVVNIIGDNRSAVIYGKKDASIFILSGSKTKFNISGVKMDRGDGSDDSNIVLNNFPGGLISITNCSLEANSSNILDKSTGAVTYIIMIVRNSYFKTYGDKSGCRSNINISTISLDTASRFEISNTSFEMAGDYNEIAYIITRSDDGNVRMRWNDVVFYSDIAEAIYMWYDVGSNVGTTNYLEVMSNCLNKRPGTIGSSAVTMLFVTTTGSLESNIDIMRPIFF